MSSDALYREGSQAAKLLVSFLLVVVVGVFFYLQALISQLLVDIQLMLDSDPVQALQLISRLLLWLVVSSGLIALVVGWYLCVLAGRVASSHEYPPPGTPTVFRTLVVKGSQAMKKRRQCLVLAGLLFCQPLAGLAVWYGITGGVL